MSAQLPLRIWLALLRSHPLAALAMAFEDAWLPIETRLFPRMFRKRNIRAMRQVHPATRKSIRAYVRSK